MEKFADKSSENVHVKIGDNIPKIEIVDGFSYATTAFFQLLFSIFRNSFLAIEYQIVTLSSTETNEKLCGRRFSE